MKTNNWFNHNCKQKKKEAKAALRTYRKQKKNEDLKKYLKARKEYDEVCKLEKKRKVKEEIEKIERCADEKNTIKFWKKISKDKKKRSVMVYEIEEKEWIKHFKNLFDSKAIEKQENMEERYQKEYVEQLDSNITTEEIKVTIRKLKDNKATGLDGIPNEFYKKENEENTCRLLQPLFNKILQLKKMAKGLGDRNNYTHT